MGDISYAKLWQQYMNNIFEKCIFYVIISVGVSDNDAITMPVTRTRSQAQIDFPARKSLRSTRSKANLSAISEPLQPSNRKRSIKQGMLSFFVKNISLKNCDDLEMYK